MGTREFIILFCLLLYMVEISLNKKLNFFLYPYICLKFAMLQLVYYSFTFLYGKYMKEIICEMMKTLEAIKGQLPK